MALGKAEIEHRFGFHKATVEGENATLPRHRDVRIRFREFAEWLDIMVSDSRAKAVMMTELETASMWAHKAISESAPLIGEGEYITPDIPGVAGTPLPNLAEPDPEVDGEQALGSVTEIAD